MPVKLPRWRSHREVEAAAIERVEPIAATARVILHLADGVTVNVAGEQVFARYMPVPGDYYIRYPDGYESVSPKKTFEDGYRLLGAEHLFAGEPDARQSAAITEPLSRFRPRYRALSAEEKDLHDELKAAYTTVERLVERIKTGRYRALALTDLEASCMWAVKELTG